MMTSTHQQSQLNHYEKKANDIPLLEIDTNLNNSKLDSLNKKQSKLNKEDAITPRVKQMTKIDYAVGVDKENINSSERSSLKTEKKKRSKGKKPKKTKLNNYLTSGPIDKSDSLSDASEKSSEKSDLAQEADLPFEEYEELTLEKLQENIQNESQGDEEIQVIEKEEIGSKDDAQLKKIDQIQENKEKLYSDISNVTSTQESDRQIKDIIDEFFDSVVEEPKVKIPALQRKDTPIPEEVQIEQELQVAEISENTEEEVVPEVPLKELEATLNDSEVTCAAEPVEPAPSQAIAEIIAAPVETKAASPPTPAPRAPLQDILKQLKAKQLERELRMFKEQQLSQRYDLANDEYQDENDFTEPENIEHENVHSVLHVDSNIMNFNTYYPGKLLGSTLMVTNLSNCEQIIELSVDQSNYTYNIQSMQSKFPNLKNDQVIPFQIKGDRIVNSEIKHESWYIENPVSKELTKRITLKLGPKAEQDFIIVVRSPTSRKTENMVSLINIGLLTFQNEAFGVKESFESFLKYNYENSMKNFLKDRKSLAQSQKVEIMVAGKVEVPKLVCLKEMALFGENSQKIIPLAVKKIASQPIQKFRFPFKNMGLSDSEVEFQFMKTCAAFNVQDPDTCKASMVQSQTASPLELTAQPSLVKVPGGQNTILNVTVKMKNSFLLHQRPEGQNKPQVFNHLLIARIKDTQIMFSFVVQASIVEETPVAVVGKTTL